jgi:hypothetical protein
MHATAPRPTPAVQLSRISTGFASIANAVFIVLWTRAVPPEAAVADFAITGSDSAWPPLLAATVYTLGMFVYAATLNDLLDARRDATRHPERPIPAGRLRSNAAVLITITALLFSLAAASWLGTPSSRAAIVTAVLILFYNATFKFLPALSFTTLGLIHAVHMLSINPHLDAIWLVILILVHATASSAAAHAIAGRRPRISSLGFAAITLGTAFWIAALVGYSYAVSGNLKPEWLSGWAFVGPLLLAVLLVLFSFSKIRRVTRGAVAAEKLQRYAAIWTPIYATAWCLSLSGTYPALQQVGFILAGLAIVGLVAVTALREVFAIVEHPVGYRR